MNTYSEIREGLVARRGTLSRRIRDIEANADRGADAAGRATVWNSEALVSFAADSEQEMALIDSSLRRIADRTFDLCIHCGTAIPERILKVFPYTASCEACTHGFDLYYFQKIRVQHADLRSCFAAVEAALDSLTSERTEGGGALFEQEEECQSVRVLLGVLRRELAEHFDLEEQAGNMQQVLVVAPRFSRAFSALQGEHALFIAQLDDIIRRCAFAGSDPDAWREIRSDYQYLSESAMRHERMESEMMSRAFLDDLGSGD